MIDTPSVELDPPAVPTRPWRNGRIAALLAGAALPAFALLTAVTMTPAFAQATGGNGGAGGRGSRRPGRHGDKSEWGQWLK